MLSKHYIFEVTVKSFSFNMFTTHQWLTKLNALLISKLNNDKHRDNYFKYEVN